MKSATQALKPLGWFRRNGNLRQVKRDEPLRELRDSISLQSLLQSLGALDFGTYGELLYGYRRFEAIEWGVEEQMPIPTELPVMLYDPGMTPDEKTIVQLTENLHREDITEPQLFQAVVALEAHGMARKEIAHMIGVSAPTATRYFAPSSCPPEAMEHFLNGRLTLLHCYKISTSSDPLATLAHFLKGGTHDQAEAAARPKSEAPGEKTASVRIPLALHSDSGLRGGRLSISGLPGQGLDLGGTETLLKDALQAVKEARKEGWTLKNAQAIWRDRAAAANAAGA